MGILSGNPMKEPMHSGEVTGVWAYTMSTNGLMRLYETWINHAGDEDLKQEISSLHQTMKQEVKQLTKLLKENGIGLPPTTPERPVANAADIPTGARLLDPEIANTVAMNLGQGMVSCSMVMGQCIREDIAMMFGQFHAAKAMAGLKMLRLMKEKAWLIVPPLHVAPQVSSKE